MKISEQTKQILHNFRTINNSMVFQPGNIIRVVHKNKFTFAEATIAESIPIEFAIFDLKKFLDILRTENECELDFQENHVKVTQWDNGKVLCTTNFIYANKNHIVHSSVSNPPSANLVTCKLTANNIKEIYRISNVLMLEDMIISGDKNTIKVKLINKGVKGLNDSFELELGDNDSGYNFDVYFKVMNLRLMEGDYEISMGNGFSEFKLDGASLKYWLSNEKDSMFIKEIDNE